MSLVVGTIEELECRLNAFGVALVGAPLGRQLIAALARAEKTDSAWRFTNTALEGTQDKLARAQSEIEQLRTRAEKAETELAVARTTLEFGSEGNLAEKIVNVQVRMTLENGRVVAKGVGTGIVLLESDWTPAMHAAAEELRAQGAEAAEIKAWAENMAGFVCDESIDTGAKVAAVLTAEATHQALAEDESEMVAIAEAMLAEPNPTPGLVEVFRRGVDDLTELREAANKRRDYLALAPDARSPLQEDLNNRHCVGKLRDIWRARRARKDTP